MRVLTPVGYRVALDRLVASMRTSSHLPEPVAEDSYALDLLCRAVLGYSSLGSRRVTGLLDYPEDVDGAPMFAWMHLAAMRGHFLNPTFSDSWLTEDAQQLLSPVLGTLSPADDAVWPYHMYDPERPEIRGRRFDATSLTAFVDTLDDLSADWQLTRVSGRWDHFHRFPLPPAVAGDLIALRYVYATAALEAATSSGVPLVGPEAGDVVLGDSDTYTCYGTYSELLRDGQLCLAKSTPYWVPTEWCDAVYDSEPPDADMLDDLRLPFHHVLVGLGRPLSIPSSIEDVRTEEPEIAAGFEKAWKEAAQRRRAAAAGDLDALVELEGDHLRPTLGSVLIVGGVMIEAIVLHADRSGRLCDDVFWCMAVPGPDDEPLVRMVAGALIPRMADDIAAVVRNIAAVVSSGDWNDPTATPAVDLRDKNAVRKAVRKGREASGELGGVRVFTVRTSSGSSERSEPTGRRLRPHQRRGHVRRLRIGPRDTWQIHQQRAIRWIPPTAVNAELGEPARDTVRRVPDPKHP